MRCRRLGVEHSCRQVLEKSCGGRDADINRKVGGRCIYICYTRERQNRPITALSVVYDDAREDPPFGFKKITNTVNGFTADLNFGNGGHRAFLCVRREIGPPIRNLALVFPSKREEAPKNYHVLQKTPSCEAANLNGGNDGNDVYLAFELGQSQPHTTRHRSELIVADLREHIASFRTSETTTSTYSNRRLWNDGMALLTCCMFTDVEAVVSQTLESIRELALLPLGLDHFIGPEHLNAVVMSICDSQLVGHSQFPRHMQSLGLQLLLDIFRRYVYQLSMPAILRIFEAGFFARHKDRQDGVSAHVTDYILLEMQQQVFNNITN